jgi:hypothetical protein
MKNDLELDVSKQGPPFTDICDAALNIGSSVVTIGLDNAIQNIDWTALLIL